jgi:histidinol-phosphatase (PHP family)
MLTDYHVHLRPDDVENTPAERYFTKANADRYRETAEQRGIQELGVAEHIYRFRQALEYWDHPWWVPQAIDDLDDYCAFVREETDLRLGIEADFVPGREDRLANILDERPWDYVIGSVHFMRGGAVDMDDQWDVWGAGESPERVWRRYFETVAEAAASGLYDVMAHPDLVKIWGRGRSWPDGDLRRYYEPAVEAFHEVGVAVEVSTAGLRKPVGEIYPSRAFLEMAIDAGLPFALSSDAHVPDQLGHGYDQAVALLEDLGVREICVFEGRKRRVETLGA